jgi:ribonuclease VapC
LDTTNTGFRTRPMVIDTSALLAILLSEPEAQAFTEEIAGAERRLIGAPTLVEATAVMVARKGRDGVIALDALLSRLGVEVVAMSPAAAEFAREAYGCYGKGVGSPGVLNYGDVLSYGVARAEDEPLLFTGGGFPRTDITSAHR